ncbi:hypothetical protein B0J14DRAFT_559177 [Halenospora varia]|nr:hypothetical protein B0J14DRAFT_559177 [Halenospora varia]
MISLVCILLLFNLISQTLGLPSFLETRQKPDTVNNNKWAFKVWNHQACSGPMTANFGDRGPTIAIDSLGCKDIIEPEKVFSARAVSPINWKMKIFTEKGCRGLEYEFKDADICVSFPDGGGLRFQSFYQLFERREAGVLDIVIRGLSVQRMGNSISLGKLAWSI